MYKCMYICMYICVYVCMYVSMHVFMYICMYVQVCLFLYTQLSIYIYYVCIDCVLALFAICGCTFSLLQRRLDLHNSTGFGGMQATLDRFPWFERMKELSVGDETIKLPRWILDSGDPTELKAIWEDRQTKELVWCLRGFSLCYVFHLSVLCRSMRVLGLLKWITFSCFGSL